MPPAQAKGFAIIDDFTITGPLNDVASLYMERRDHINFKDNTNKTFIFMPDPDNIPADFSQWAGEQQLEIKQLEIISRNKQRATEFLAKKLAEIDRTCDQL
jgi:hypothetical protein